MKELVQAMGETVPAEVREVTEGLQYRDFITVGLLLKKLKLREPGRARWHIDRGQLDLCARE